MKQYLYKNQSDGHYSFYPVDTIERVAPYLKLIGEINEIMEQNANLTNTNQQLKFQLRQKLIS